MKKHAIADRRSTAVPSQRQGLPKEQAIVGCQPSERLWHGRRLLHEDVSAAKSIADMTLDPVWPTLPTAR
jgi:hypothetical protein